MEPLTEFQKIGSRYPPYLIAEIGLNHNGDLDLARRLVDAAADSGASAAKFQMFSSDEFIGEDAELGGAGPGSLREFFRSFELSSEEWDRLAAHTRGAGLDFLCSIFDQTSLDRYLALNPEMVKIASGDLTNTPLIRATLAANLPLLISTGMAEETEIEELVGSLPPGTKFLLLQCVSSYPARPEEYNLRTLLRWSEKYSCPVGLSDHTSDHTLAAAAVALGATLVEKHFTLDRNLPGPDQKMSLEPRDFRELERITRTVWESLGDGRKRCMPSERGARTAARRSLYSTRDLPSKHNLGDSDLIALRPGGGIPAAELEHLIGRKLRIPLAAGKRLEYDDLE